MSAVQRVEEALERFNGALLCDEVGMGKTYVAIAVARRFRVRLIVTPAALVAMWQTALATTQIDAEVVTFEALSRADANTFRRGGADSPQHAYEFVAIDEAHHARNPRTNRYFALEHLTRRAKVLLLTATPIHNRRNDLVALLSLFLGSRASTMTTSELAQCIVRREQRQLQRSVRIPAVRQPVRHHVGDSPGLVDTLMSLPPPVPFRDGGIAGALVGRGLVHQWASSEAALREALRRRIARAGALCVSLEAGTYPTFAELESWVYDDGALQLGFAELLCTAVASHTELLDGVRAHLAALQSVLTRFKSGGNIDANRTEAVGTIRRTRDKSRIVAFAQYAETVAMLYRRLAHTGYVALLTSHGARVAGGSLTRQEAIARFAPSATGCAPPAPSEAIHLLLTTDLLSEGVNLQDADTVVHLDIPWTAARMEQRVGRAARLGSAHREVHVHEISPPASALTVLESDRIVKQKWALARTEERTPGKVERLREILESWRTSLGSEPSTSRNSRHTPAHSEASSPQLGSVRSDISGFIAAVTLDGVTNLLVRSCDAPTTDLDTQLEICGQAQCEDAPIDLQRAADALRAIEEWCVKRRATSAAGADASAALGRRQLVMRIDASIDAAPPHLRSFRLPLASRARDVVTRHQSAAVERALEELSRVDLPDDEWLAAVINVDTGQATRHSDAECVQIHAVLLLESQRD